jgi:hypothetical protein
MEGVGLRINPGKHGNLDKYAHVLFSPLVPLMPNIQVMCARRSQGHLSFWRVIRAFGIVKETF